MLFETGKANVNQRDPTQSGKTLCYIAAEQRHHEVLRFLVKYKADTNRATADGWTPCHIAAMNGDCTALQILVKDGRADVNCATQKSGLTPCHLAVKHGSPGALRFLLI